jgi:hypothetical protein
MPAWAVKCFRTEGGRDLFDRDYGRQASKVRALPSMDFWLRRTSLDGVAPMDLIGSVEDIGN